MPFVISILLQMKKMMHLLVLKEDYAYAAATYGQMMAGWILVIIITTTVLVT